MYGLKPVPFKIEFFRSLLRPSFYSVVRPRRTTLSHEISS